MIDVNQAYAVPLLTGGGDYVQHVVPDGGLLVALLRGKTIVHGYYTENHPFQRHIEVGMGSLTL